jgi:lipoprotein-anchoring transpeptidase ErfK/SrfK
MVQSSLSRREFLKMAAAGAGSLALPWQVPPLANIPDFPKSERLGRAAKGTLELKPRPDPDSATLGILYEDAVVPWLREVIGERPNYAHNNQRWVETPDGYVYGALFQPVRNLPNKPVISLTESSRGPGMWVEVTVPYVDAILENKPTSNSWVEAKVEEGIPLRFYYSQVFWVDQIRSSERGVFYRVNPNYFGGVDLLWAAAEAFRPIQPDELAPISPDVTDKRVVVDVNHQMLSCYEGKGEVYYCRVSTGAKFDIFGNTVDKWSTPVGQHKVTRKYVSLQMSGGTTGAGYDLPGIGWSAIFATGGVAVHSTFWHNSFGDPRSHGCVNVLPEDAKWLFRWTLPNVAFDPGMEDITLTGAESTPVAVIEG